MKKTRLGYFLLILTLILITYSSFRTKRANSSAEDWLFISGFLSAIIFWFWMIVDFMSNRKNLNHPTLWGVFLLLGSWLAAAIYFFVKYKEPAGKCSYSRFRAWIFNGNNNRDFYVKVAVVSYVIALFHHNLMQTLYMTIGIHNP